MSSSITKTPQSTPLQTLRFRWGECPISTKNYSKLVVFSKRQMAPPWPSNPCLFRFFGWFSLFFCALSPSFPGIFRVQQKENSFFLGGVLAVLQKKQGLEGQGIFTLIRSDSFTLFSEPRGLSGGGGIGKGGREGAGGVVTYRWEGKTGTIWQSRVCHEGRKLPDTVFLGGKARKCCRFWVFACVPKAGKQSTWIQRPPSARKQSTKTMPKKNGPVFTHVQLPFRGPKLTQQAARGLG